MKNYDVEKNFNPHLLTEDQMNRIITINNEAKKLAVLILELCPEQRERAIALTKLEEVVMWTDASISRDECIKDDEEDFLSYRPTLFPVRNSRYKVGDTVLLKTKDELIKEYPDKWDEGNNRFNYSIRILHSMMISLGTPLRIDGIDETGTFGFDSGDWSWPFEVIKEKVNK